MAIDNTGISSLETGAPDIKYTGDEGPKSPQQMTGMGNVMKLFENYDGSFDRDTFDAMYNDFLEDNRGMKLYNFAENWLGFVKKDPVLPRGIPAEQLIGEEQGREIASAILGDESGDIASELWSRMSPSERSEWGSIENFMQSDDFKIILINLQTRRGSREGIQMASAADDMLPTANMNIGGRVGLANGQLVKPSRHGLRPGYRGPGTYQGRGMTGSDSRNTKGAPAGGATIGSGSIQSGSPRDYSPPAQQIIGGKTYDVTPETRDQRDLLFETQKEKKEKKTDDFIDEEIDYPKYTPTIIRFLANANREKNRRFFIDRVLKAGKIPGYANLYDEKFDIEDAYQQYMANRLAGRTDAMGRPIEGFSYDSKGKLVGDFIDDNYNTGIQTAALPTATDATGTGTTPAATTTSTIATGPITGQLGGINTAHHPILANIYGVPEADFLNQYPMFAADGGRAGYAGGGIADLRQGYFLGKLVKKAGRALKKVAKSPIGRMGLMALGGWGLNQWKPDFFNKGIFAKDSFLAPLLRSRGKDWTKDNPTWGDYSPWKLGIGAASLYPLIAGMGDDEDDDFTKTDLYKKWLAQKQGWDQTFAPVGDPTNWQRHRLYSADGGRIGYDNGGGIMMASAPDPMDTRNDMMQNLALEHYGKPLKYLDEKEIREIEEMMDDMDPYGTLPFDFDKGLDKLATEKHNKPYKLLTPDQQDEILDIMERIGKKVFAADGGRIGYAEGGNDDEEGHRSAALSAMYGLRKNAQEGGLMDLGGMEKDYRNEGGFVPIGGQERADDVPARLSKNEFVFTADAVRNAGGGDIDKGAEIMENLMENLEQGGKVSEESQGLEGARDMFATAQRLEGVL